MYPNGTYYKKGDYNIICDRTGFKIKGSQAKMEWDKAFVRKQDWEERHPQDYVSTVPDYMTVPIPRPEGGDVFLGINEVQPGDL